MSAPLTVDQVLMACRVHGLPYRPDERQPDGLWQARCPICALYADGEVLTIRQNGRGARLACRNGCSPGEIAAYLATPPASLDPPAANGLAVRTADLSLSRPPEWAWLHFVVLAALNLMVGAEGAGKGTFACWIFSRLTRGTLPGDLYGNPATVAIVGDEDGFDAVWVPRLHAAGADLSRVKLIERGDGGLIEMAADRERLGDAVRTFGVRLLYLDQLTDNLGAAVDDWRAKQVREALAPARQLARELDCAVLGALHPNKGGSSFRQLVSGSFAFNALSRSSLLLAEHPDDPGRRVVTRAKGNLSATPDAVEFAIEGHTFEANGHTFNVPRAVDVQTSTLTTDDLLNKPAPVGEARADARELVSDALADGEWHPAAAIIRDCEGRGVYKRAAQRAADDLGVEREKRGFPAASHWRISSGDTRGDTPTAVIPVTSVTSENLAYIDRGDTSDTDDSDIGVTSAVTAGALPLNALTADCEVEL